METNDWKLRGNSDITSASSHSIARVIADVKKYINQSDERPIIPLSIGDPSIFPCFRTDRVAEDAVVDALRSARFNAYAPKGGALQPKRYSFTLLRFNCYAPNCYC